MALVKLLVHCAGCGCEVSWSPFMQGNRPFCCRECAEGGECRCSYPDYDEERTS